MRNPASIRRIKEIFVSYSFLMPSILILFVFGILPMFITIFLSFSQYDLLSPPSFAGLINFERLIRDKAFIISMQNTLKYMIVIVPLDTIIALILALFLHYRVKIRISKDFFAGAYFVPVITSTVVSSLIWKILYNPTFGQINWILSKVGLPTQIWLGDPRFALLSISVVVIWRSVGYYMVIIWAGLQEIPQEIEEAARMDGAVGLSLIRYIVVPLLAPTLLLVVVVCTIDTLQIFSEVWIMTLGGPGYVTRSAVLEIYETVFRHWRIGAGAAKALILFIAVLILSGINLRVLQRGMETYY